MSKALLCHCLAEIEFEGFLLKTLHGRDISQVLHDFEVETPEESIAMKENPEQTPSKGISEMTRDILLTYYFQSVKSPDALFTRRLHFV